MGKEEIEKHEILVSEITEILDWVHKAVWVVCPGLQNNSDVLISIPEYFLDALVYKQEKLTGYAVNKKDYTLFGCKVQPAYENKITVFNKHRFYTKQEYLQLQLNTNLSK